MLSALAEVGVPYRSRASSPGSGFDCSGLTMYAWAQAGVALPHQDRSQIGVSAARTWDTRSAGRSRGVPGPRDDVPRRRRGHRARAEHGDGGAGAGARRPQRPPRQPPGLRSAAGRASTDYRVAEATRYRRRRSQAVSARRRCGGVPLRAPVRGRESAPRRRPQPDSAAQCGGGPREHRLSERIEWRSRRRPQPDSAAAVQRVPSEHRLSERSESAPRRRPRLTVPPQCGGGPSRAPIVRAKRVGAEEAPQPNELRRCPRGSDGAARPVRRAMISAQIETAVSSGVRAPMSRPMGAMIALELLRVGDAHLGQALHAAWRGSCGCPSRRCSRRGCAARPRWRARRTWGRG